MSLDWGTTKNNTNRLSLGNTALGGASTFTVVSWSAFNIATNNTIGRVFSRSNGINFNLHHRRTTTNNGRAVFVRAYSTTTLYVTSTYGDVDPDGLWTFTAAVDHGAGNTPHMYLGDENTPAAEPTYAAQVSPVGTETTGSFETLIGSHYNGSIYSNSYTGRIAFVAIFDAALTQAEIRAIQFNPVAASLARSDLAGMWMPGLNGTTNIYDLSGNGFTATKGGTLNFAANPPFVRTMPLIGAGLAARLASGSHALLADDVESTSEVSVPAVGQVQALLADDAESASEVSAPTLTESHALLADDTESASEVTTPAVAQVNALLADDAESASEVTTPTVGQAQALLADDVESTSEVTNPAVAESHALLADDTESASEVTVPAVGQVQALLADDTESASEVTSPTVGQVHALLADDVESASEVTSPTVVIVGAFDPRITINGTPAAAKVITGAPAGAANITGSPAGPKSITGDSDVDPANITQFYKGEPVEIQLFAKAPGGTAVIASPASQVIKVTISASKGGTALLDFSDKAALIDGNTGEYQIILADADITLLVEGRTYYYNIWSQLAANDPRLQKWGSLTLGAAVAAA